MTEGGGWPPVAYVDILSGSMEVVVLQGEAARLGRNQRSGSDSLPPALAGASKKKIVGSEAEDARSAAQKVVGGERIGRTGKE